VTPNIKILCDIISHVHLGTLKSCLTPELITKIMYKYFPLQAKYNAHVFCRNIKNFASGRSSDSPEEELEGKR
jgi:hypothetical protein